METTVRSIVGGALQTHLLLNKQYLPLNNTTLNQKFSCQENAKLLDGEYPSIKYVTIGCGGHTLATDETGFCYVKSNVHKPTDFALFKHLPFVCRKLDNDLTSTERLKYRLRVLEKGLDGNTYVCYYARVLDMSETNPTINIVTSQNGTVSLKAFEPTRDNLSPTPTVLSNTSVNTTTGDYLACNAICSLELSNPDITEVLNAAEIMFGNTNYAIISEIGICTGVDRQVLGNFAGNQQQYTDAVCCQLFSTSSCFHDLNSTRSKLSITINCGSVESLLV